MFSHNVMKDVFYLQTKVTAMGVACMCLQMHTFRFLGESFFVAMARIPWTNVCAVLDELY